MHYPAHVGHGVLKKVHLLLLATQCAVLVESSAVKQNLFELQTCQESASPCAGFVAALESDSQLAVAVSLVQKKGGPVEIFPRSAKLTINSTGAAVTQSLNQSGNATPQQPEVGGTTEREEKLKGLAKAMHENWMNISQAAGKLDDDTKAKLIYAIKHHMMNAMSWTKAYMQEGTGKDEPSESHQLPQFSAMQSITVATGEVVCNTSNDILVLMPLFLGRDKVKLAGMYMVIKLLISFLLSWILSPWREKAPVSYSITAKSLSIALPALVALKFFFEWYHKDEEEEEEVEYQPRSSASPPEDASGPECTQSKGEPEEDPIFQRLLFRMSAAMPSSRQRMRYWILLQLCFATNFDKFGVFAHLFALKMTYTELVLGHLIASLLIALTLLGLSQLWMIKFTFSRIPFWFMLVLISMYAMTCQLSLVLINNMQLPA